MSIILSIIMGYWKYKVVMVFGYYVIMIINYLVRDKMLLVVLVVG